jgi:hypothetical protein
MSDTTQTYRSIADIMWRGMTVQEACKELKLDWLEIRKTMPIEVKRYLVDVSMLANAREEYLGALPTDN